MGRPKGPLGCWTDRQLRTERARLSRIVTQLDEHRGEEFVDVVTVMWPGWRPRPHQQRVEVVPGLRGELRASWTSRTRHWALLRLKRRTALVVLVLKGRAALGDLLRARRVDPQALGLSGGESLPHPPTPENLAWMLRTRQENEAAEKDGK